MTRRWRPSLPQAVVAGLLALVDAARRSGVVVERVGDSPTPARPDAELLSLCREIAGCDRIADTARAYDVPVWDAPVAFKAVQARMSEAMRDKAKLIPRVIELEATTPAGALAQARPFGNTRDLRALAARAAVEDLARIPNSENDYRA